MQGADPGACRTRDRMTCLHIAVSQGRRGAVAAILAWAQGRPQKVGDDDGNEENGAGIDHTVIKGAGSTALASVPPPPPPPSPSLFRRASSCASSSSSAAASSVCGCSFAGVYECESKGGDDGPYQDDGVVELEEDEDEGSLDWGDGLGVSVIHRRDDEGRNALHHAAEQGDPCIVTMLMRAGADPWPRDLLGYAAADRARMNANRVALGIIQVGSGTNACMNTYTYVDLSVSNTPTNRTIQNIQQHKQEPERALLLCRLRLLNDAFNANCTPRAVLEGNKALMPAPPPPQQHKHRQPRQRDGDVAALPMPASKRPRLELKPEPDATPAQAAAAAASSSTTTAVSTTTTAEGEEEEEGGGEARDRPLSFACRHAVWEAACATPRMRLVRRVLRGVVGGGGADGKGAGLQPDMFKELLAYVQPPWDPALAAAASTAGPR